MGYSNEWNLVEMMVCDSQDFVIKGNAASSLCSLLDHSLWGKPAAIMRALKQPYDSLM